MLSVISKNSYINPLKNYYDGKYYILLPQNKTMESVGILSCRYISTNTRRYV